MDQRQDNTATQQHKHEHHPTSEQSLSPSTRQDASGNADASSKDKVNTNMDTVKPQLTHTNNSTEPYTVFGHHRLMIIVAVISFAGLISPLTGNIYFPALPAITADLKSTPELINITVTVYLIFQGVAPSFWATLADVMGRRPIYIASLVVFLGACIGLAETKNYAQLLVLRMVQASGSSSVIAIGAGTIADLTVPSQRGKYMGWFAVGSLVGPVLGPIIGGVAAAHLGWRYIFWILFAICAAVLIVILVLLPETNRIIVGNGSVKINPSWMYTCLFDSFNSSTLFKSEKHIEADWFKGIGYKFIYSLTTLARPQAALTLAYISIVFASFYCVTITASYVFQDQYGLSETNVGLCYLAFGIGAILGSLAGGYILDHDYRTVAKIVKKAATADAEKAAPKRGQYDPEFVYEKARFRTFFLFSSVFPIAMVGYGWSISANAPLAVPLVMQFIIGFASSTIMNAVTTYLVDVSPGKGSSITAANNLARCITAAICSVWIQPAANAIGNGPIFTIIAGVDFLALGTIITLLYRGREWRIKEYDANRSKESNPKP